MKHWKLIVVLCLFLSVCMLAGCNLGVANLLETTGEATSETTGETAGEPDEGLLAPFDYTLEDGDYTITGVKDQAATSYEIPSYVTSIGDYAFSGCLSLESIVVPEGVTSIGEYAFSGCVALSHIELPVSVTSIGASAFRSCSALRSIEIPAGVTSIEEYAFYECKKLADVSFAENSRLTTFGEKSFGNCLALTSITILPGVVSIESEAFYGCCHLVEVYDLSPSITVEKGSDGNGRIGYYARDVYTEKDAPSKLSTDENGYRFCVDDGACYLIGYVGDDTELTLPESYRGQSYEIYKNAFQSCAALTSIVIPEGVTSIGDWAFYSCDLLTSITIPASVTGIGEGAFQKCDSLESITIPFVGATRNGSENTYFGYIFGAWDGGFNSSYIPTSLKSVVITGGESIGEEAFFGCSSLESITIPATVTRIGSAAFARCGSLTSIVVEEGNPTYHVAGNCLMETATNTVIRGCNNSVFPENMTNIGAYAFSGCKGISSIVIPDRVTGIGEGAFQKCDSLESITIPFVGAAKDEFDDDHFGYIFGASDDYSNELYVPVSLKTVVITGGEHIGFDAFSGCSSLESITIPDSVTSIGPDAFYGCSSLTSIVIPEGVMGLGRSTFKGCSSLTSIEIPVSVKGIGSSSFEGCSSLERVYYGGTEAEWSEISIEEDNSDLTSATIYYSYGKE